MKKFLDENFLLQNATAQKLYHDFAKQMPIIDYHCHLPPDQIAKDINFENLTQVWLYGDHYKWRAMRTNGVDESFCTGDKPDFEKLKNGRKRFLIPYAIHYITGRTWNCSAILMSLNY
jgi:glucuronate isomerase